MVDESRSYKLEAGCRAGCRFIVVDRGHLASDGHDIDKQAKKDAIRTTEECSSITIPATTGSRRFCAPVADQGSTLVREECGLKEVQSKSRGELQRSLRPDLLDDGAEMCGGYRLPGKSKFR